MTAMQSSIPMDRLGHTARNHRPYGGALPRRGRRLKP